MSKTLKVLELIVTLTELVAAVCLVMSILEKKRMENELNKLSVESEN